MAKQIHTNVGPICIHYECGFTAVLAELTHEPHRARQRVDEGALSVGPAPVRTGSAHASRAACRKPLVFHPLRRGRGSRRYV